MLNMTTPTILGALGGAAFAIVYAWYQRYKTTPRVPAPSMQTRVNVLERRQAINGIYVQVIQMRDKTEQARMARIGEFIKKDVLLLEDMIKTLDDQLSLINTAGPEVQDVGADMLARTHGCKWKFKVEKIKMRWELEN